MRAWEWASECKNWEKHVKLNGNLVVTTFFSFTTTVSQFSNFNETRLWVCRDFGWEIRSEREWTQCVIVSLTKTKHKQLKDKKINRQDSRRCINAKAENCFDKKYPFFSCFNSFFRLFLFLFWFDFFFFRCCSFLSRILQFFVCLEYKKKRNTIK